MMPESKKPLGVVKSTKSWKDMTDEEIDALSAKLFRQMLDKLPPSPDQQPLPPRPAE